MKTKLPPRRWLIVFFITVIFAIIFRNHISTEAYVLAAIIWAFSFWANLPES